ncbi:MAG TPA: hypothetical protein VHY18_10755 [Solirubrobacteraceae bacterium]|nr:hypothetical protein [Solirubrobacteraceae bacterium]
MKAQKNSIEITGDERFFGNGDLPVLDAFTGVQLTPIGDPEAWARNLPFAFRAGDLVASIIHDDNPEPVPAVCGADFQKAPAGSFEAQQACGR